MDTLISGVQTVIGPAPAGAEVMEYGFAGIILCVVIACIFRIVTKVFA